MRGSMNAMSQSSQWTCHKAGFSLVELLVSISLIALLMSLLVPGLGRARRQARSMTCMSRVRQLGLAFHAYAHDHDDYALPTSIDGRTFWWGRLNPDAVDHTKGTMWPYLAGELRVQGVYECPAQPYGTYGLQGKPFGEPDDPKWVTSTYGYNGYFLSPAHSVWSGIGFRPWQKVCSIQGADQVFTFADTLLSWDLTGKRLNVSNTAMLDPPFLFNGKGWQKNPSPTTCFRHLDRAVVAFADGHCAAVASQDPYVHKLAKVGSVGTSNAPHYVPDYLDWSSAEP
jgi:prepilin-type N-terminal cleavage/methylation domain-containing protein/prepilin-type processing-associated H-X9-DG protein